MWAVHLYPMQRGFGSRVGIGWDGRFWRRCLFRRRASGLAGGRLLDRSVGRSNWARLKTFSVSPTATVNHRSRCVSSKSSACVVVFLMNTKATESHFSLTRVSGSVAEFPTNRIDENFLPGKLIGTIIINNEKIIMKRNYESKSVPLASPWWNRLAQSTQICT